MQKTFENVERKEKKRENEGKKERLRSIYCIHYDYAADI